MASRTLINTATTNGVTIKTYREADGGLFFEYFGTSGDDRINAGNGGNAHIEGRSGFDSLTGGDGDDAIYGGGKRDVIRGGAGDDIIIGQGGKDILFGEAGNDLIRGKKDADMLDGGDGDDMLFGHLGSDRLIGGAGKDMMVGGRDADVFVISSGGETTDPSAYDADWVLDFFDGRDKVEATEGTKVSIEKVDADGDGAVDDLQVYEAGKHSLVLINFSGTFTSEDLVFGNEVDII